MWPIASLTSAAREIAATRDPSKRMPKPAVEDEVGELAATLEQMLRSLDAARSEREETMQRQSEFVADASHELRTPLTSVLANLELLQASLGGADQEEDREIVDSALRSSRRMSRLVADLLLLARADAGRLDQHRACDLAEIAGDAALEAAPLMGERVLTVENDRALPVDGSPDELHRMIVNLLENAARYTPPDAQIDLTLSREDGDAVVEVADDGPGIPPRDADPDLRPLRPRPGPRRHPQRHRDRPRPGDRQRRRRRARRLRGRGGIRRGRRPVPRPDPGSRDREEG